MTVADIHFIWLAQMAEASYKIQGLQIFPPIICIDLEEIF